MKVHFYLVESQRRAIPVVPFKVIFFSAPFGVLTEIEAPLCLPLFTGFMICHWY
jgi:hypothetical protein